MCSLVSVDTVLRDGCRHQGGTWDRADAEPGPLAALKAAWQGEVHLGTGLGVCRAANVTAAAARAVTLHAALSEHAGWQPLILHEYTSATHGRWLESVARPNTLLNKEYAHWISDCPLVRSPQMKSDCPHVMRCTAWRPCWRRWPAAAAQPMRCNSRRGGLACEGFWMRAAAVGFIPDAPAVGLCADARVVPPCKHFGNSSGGFNLCP